MDIQKHDFDILMRRMPSVSYPYEITSNKIEESQYPLKMAVSLGKKHLVWFTFYGQQNVCLLLCINQYQKIVSIVQLDTMCNNTAIYHGTILYGNVLQLHDKPTFLIEDIFWWNGISLKDTPFGYKLGYLQKTLKSIESTDNLKIGMHTMWIDDDSKPIIPYVVHHMQRRCLEHIKPIINVSSNHTPNNSVGHAINLKPNHPLNANYAKPQYKYLTNFYVMADSATDIYRLYTANNTYFDVAYVPNYKSSVYLNGIFRKIKANTDLDAIEMSDDEDDDDSTDTKKRIVMQCVFHCRFKKFVPIKVLPDTEPVIGNQFL